MPDVVVHVSNVGVVGLGAWYGLDLIANRPSVQSSIIGR